MPTPDPAPAKAGATAADADRPDRATALEAVRTLLRWAGDDPKGR